MRGTRTALSGHSSNGWRNRLTYLRSTVAAEVRPLPELGVHARLPHRRFTATSACENTPSHLGRIEGAN